MAERPKPLQDFLDALRGEIGRRQWGAAAGRCLWRVFDALDRAYPVEAEAPARLPACAYLEDALATARQGGPALAGIADAFAALEPHLAWTRRASADHTASANFADGHANAMIVGPNGYEPRTDVWVGVSLLAPDVRYPDHHHAPEEIYLVLSKGRFRQGEDDWFEPGIGGSLYNTPHIKHAMASGSTPLFAVWCLAPAK
ncbi:MAG: dimethylsulfonioproprionate lyase family protein [Parvibaculaceae bacterium]